MSGTAEAPAVTAAGASPVTEIKGVISAMQAVVDSLPPTDGVAAFTTLYLAVTKAVRASANALAFEDQHFTRALDVAFANLFFDALRKVATEDRSVPAAWAPLVKSRARTDVFPLQFALAGMNAHINRDLPVALVETCTAFGIKPSEATPQHRDFQRVDGVLAKTKARVKSRFITGDLAEVDGALGHLDDCVAMWSVARAREAAWTNAQALWALRGVPPLRARFLLTLDRMVGFAGRGLLCPYATKAPIA